MFFVWWSLKQKYWIVFLVCSKENCPRLVCCREHTEHKTTRNLRDSLLTDICQKCRDRHFGQSPAEIKKPKSDAGWPKWGHHHSIRQILELCLHSLLSVKGSRWLEDVICPWVDFSPFPMDRSLKTQSKCWNSIMWEKRSIYL